MKKVIKEQVKSEVSKITPQIEKLVNEQLESEVLVQSSKEAKTSHAIAANLSELKLKKILIDKMEANKSISRPQDGADDDQEPSAGIDRGSKRRRSGKEPESTNAPREKTTTIARKTTTGSKTHKQSASQSTPVEETMQSIDVFEAPAHQEFETGVHDEQPEEEVHPLPDWFQQPKRLPSPDRTWNKAYIKWKEDLSVPTQWGSDSQLRQIRSLGILTFGSKKDDNSMHLLGTRDIS
ncbi:hypothetical protein Tco_0060749 [Tanacetum coccineum]